ncbi:MAG: ADP-ribosylglycohydrolase family protein [Sporomusaceae bacterium]|nr:ADP-ribosylglycohydrolase family protein [Sporomusaceae bacterium]
MKRQKEYFRGCLLGGAIGDAMGYPIEFMKIEEIRNKYGKLGLTEIETNANGIAEITDDTQMTLFTAEGILRAASRSMEKGGVCHPPSVVYHAYLRWFDTQYGPGAINPELLNSWLYKIPELHVMRDPGHTCISALRSGLMGTLEKPTTNSKGCGGVMRTAPIGLSIYDHEFKIGCECAAITHGHPSGYIPAGILAQMVSRLIKGATLKNALDTSLTLAKTYEGCAESIDIIQKALNLAQSEITPVEAITELGEGWTGEEALAIAIYCSFKFPNDFRQAIIAAVNHSGDSDSTGAITGNILGAYLGVNAIPEEWLSVLELKEVIIQLADDLLKKYEASVEWHERYPGF